MHTTGCDASDLNMTVTLDRTVRMETKIADGVTLVDHRVKYCPTPWNDSSHASRLEGEYRTIPAINREISLVKHLSQNLSNSECGKIDQNELGASDTPFVPLVLGQST